MIKSRAAPQGSSPTPPLSIEAVRRRARHRLIGASMLVLVGVVGFSLLFDTQPRPIAVDIPIEIPAKAAPVASNLPEKALENEAMAVQIEKEGAPPRNDPPAAETASVPAAEPVAQSVAAPVPPPVLAPAPAPAASAAPSAASAEPAAPSDASALRVVVQVGAFAENARAQEVRIKIEASGMKTYTQVAQTPQGRRIRVRVGPFGTRAEAEKAAERVKALGYPAAILTL